MRNAKKLVSQLCQDILEERPRGTVRDVWEWMCGGDRGMEEAAGEHGPRVRDMRARTGPEDVEAWTQLATALLKNQRYTAAIEVLHVAIGCEPSDGRAWLTLGQAYYLAGRLGDARAALQIAQRNHGPASRIQRCLERIACEEKVRRSRHGQTDNLDVSLE